MMNPLLADLISDAKNRLGYSYESMSKACGGVPGSGRIHQLATKPLKTFPDPDTINGLARGCKVSPLDIIKASARSLGLNVSDDDGDQVRIPGFDHLPAQVRDTFRDLGQQVGELAKRAGDGDGEATSLTDAGGTPATQTDFRWGRAAEIRNSDEQPSVERRSDRSRPGRRTTRSAVDGKYRSVEATQKEADQMPVEEIMQHAAYDTDESGGD